MEIDTQYAVRMFFPNPAFHQIYFEAVANAFDAGASRIRIEIDSDGSIRPPRHLIVKVLDNGGGFTEERFAHFRRLQEPQDSYHKGLGRLVYLQYFKRLGVVSHFDGRVRTFEFNDQFDGESVVESRESPKGWATELTFRDFRGDQIHSFDDLKPSSIRRQLLDQFLPRLQNMKAAGANFTIEIALTTDEARDQHDFFSGTVRITPEDIPRFQVKTITAPELGAFDSIRMSYVLRKDGGDGSVATMVSVDQRAIPIALVPPRALPVGNSATFLFESELFTGRSDSARQRLVLPEGISDEMLFKVLRLEVATILDEEFPEIEQRNSQVQARLEDQYPHLSGLFDQKAVGLLDREVALRSAQNRFLAKQKEVLEGGRIDEETYLTSIELSSRSLAEYIVYRDLIIKRLAAISGDEDESTVHNLIVPQYTRHEGEDLLSKLYNNNAWLLDDRFMAFRTVLSEVQMSEVIREITSQEAEAEERGRPDISLIFSADPEVSEHVEVVIVEVKKRKVDDKEGPYSGTQLAKRARKLVEYCPNITRMWYFGVVEIDEVLSQTLRDSNWTPLFSRGQIFFQNRWIDDIPAPTYIVSFDAVISDAAARNHTFLEILKSDLRAQATWNAG